MPSGDMNFNTDKWITNPSLEPIDKQRTPASEEIYRRELKAMIDAFRVFPCIVVWVPFNEAWGQFNTVEISNWTKAYDPSRLVNPASGGNFHAVGDMHDLHNYPDPVIHRPEVYGKDRAVVLGEFGGLGLPIEGHTWSDKSNWGYQSFKTKEELFNRYQSLLEKLQTLIQKGLSAAVYTQTTDVESEVNGLMTYDRKVMKFNQDSIRNVNMKLYKIKNE
jgi:beta-galactosidase/beta-glucuronidase